MEAEASTAVWSDPFDPPERRRVARPRSVLLPASRSIWGTTHVSAALSRVVRVDVAGVVAGVAVVVISAVLLGVGRLSWPRLTRQWQRRRAQRLCAQGQHTWKQLDEGTLQDGPDGASRDVLINCSGCGRRDTVDIWDIP